MRVAAQKQNNCSEQSAKGLALDAAVRQLARGSESQARGSVVAFHAGVQNHDLNKGKDPGRRGVVQIISGAELRG